MKVSFFPLSSFRGVSDSPPPLPPPPPLQTKVAPRGGEAQRKHGRERGLYFLSVKFTTQAVLFKNTHTFKPNRGFGHLTAMLQEYLHCGDKVWHISLSSAGCLAVCHAGSWFNIEPFSFFFICMKYSVRNGAECMEQPRKSHRKKEKHLLKPIMGRKIKIIIITTILRLHMKEKMT